MDHGQRVREVVRQRPCPEGRRERWHRLLLAPQRGKVLSIILSDSVVGYDMHWVALERGKGYLTLCLGPDCCRCCQAGWVPFWYGWLAVSEVPSGKQCLQPIPQAAYAHCDGLRRHDGHLRGRGLAVQRMVEGRTGPQAAELLAAVAGLVPQAWDVEEEIMRRFGREPISVRLAQEGGAK